MLKGFSLSTVLKEMAAAAGVNRDGRTDEAAPCSKRTRTVLKEDAAAAGVNRDQNGPDLPLRKVPIYPCSQVQVEEMVFFSVHNYSTLHI